MIRMSERKIKSLMGCVMLALSIHSVAWAQADTIEQFKERLNQKDHFSMAQLSQLFSQQKPDASILTLEQTPYQKKPWLEFQKALVTPQRIEEGVLFFNAHKAVLLETEKKYHVDPFVITAIIGFESNYGNYKGHYEALNSLYTLGFYYPPREEYFQKQLENLLLLAREWHKPVETIESSFDGGLGLPQFMPDMYREMAKPYIPGQFPDLIHNANDAIVSVAYYLQQAHWQPGSFIAKPIEYRGQSKQPDCHYKKTPSYTALQLSHTGFMMPHTIMPNTMGCVQLQDNEQIYYWVIGDNFYAIQKYNPQIYYALVVNDLSLAIAKTVQS